MVTPIREMSEYERVVFGRWQRAELTTDQKQITEVCNIALKIVANQKRYEAVASALKIPFWVVGCLHYRETSLDFNRHLHNGDPLVARTVHVPPGRPVNGQPPFTWEESAMDALTIKHWNPAGDWDVVHALVRMEGYNGFGYKTKGVPSPYIWSYTSEYTSGKYASDGKYDSTEVDKEAGCAAIMIWLKRLGVNMELIYPA